MTRELAAHHDAATRTPAFAAALLVHRGAPGLSITELCQRARRPGAIRAALAHVLGCPACVVGALCPAGARRVATIGRPRRRKGAA
jgi:hypothetical protein